MNSRLRVLTLFSGACGGWDLGMERAGYRVVAACEADPWRRAALQRNFPNSRIYDDVRTLTADRLRADLGSLPDVIVGSPPCQDASSANHFGHGINGARTGLFAEFVRLVAEVRPVWFAAENVARLASRGLDRLLGDMERRGYAVWPLLMAAADFGAPHERDRLWLVGVDADQDYEPRKPLNGEVGGLVGPHPWAEPWPLAAGRFCRVADGLSAHVARDAAAALGDAVVPQIAEAIGRVMGRMLPDAGRAA